MEDGNSAAEIPDELSEEPKISLEQNGNGTASVLQEKPESPGKRGVIIVTVPVKDIGAVRKAIIKLVSWVVGSPLTWAMHWAIRVDDTYFELQRPGGLGKPHLAATVWSEEKRKGIITVCPMGSTLMTNEEIIVAGQAYFAENRMWYDIFSNNCQLFVKFCLKRIAPAAAESPTPMTSSFENTISLMLAFAIQLVSLPFMTAYLRWLRWRGCDQYNLQAYATLFSIFAGITGTMTLTLLSQSYYLLASTIYSNEKLVVVILASFQSAPMVLSMLISMPVVTFPRARQRKDGTWIVSTIMIQNNEEALDPDAAIKKGIPVLAILLGSCVGLTLWIYIAVPFLIVRCFKALRGHISFGSPGRFAESFWELLMMPAIEFDSDNIKKDGSNDAEIQDSKVKGD
ncbi:hypothetical protein FGG08_002496 [Glutinoglossum americanum]|uniref:Uncharacterized protein n=1 Tax=Glutinoglossum americanum TaxID=1670608 RepID=A0A9P8L5I7_9PEZI|nr:hypothetical protein FGG08_002496 [Glutinoglossum americanum]